MFGKVRSALNSNISQRIPIVKVNKKIKNREFGLAIFKLSMERTVEAISADKKPPRTWLGESSHVVIQKRWSLIAMPLYKAKMSEKKRICERKGFLFILNIISAWEAKENKEAAPFGERLSLRLSTDVLRLTHC